MDKKEVLKRIREFIIREGLQEPFYNKVYNGAYFYCVFPKMKCGIAENGSVINEEGWTVFNISDNPESLEEALKLVKKALVEAYTELPVKEEAADKQLDKISAPEKLVQNIINSLLMPGKFYKPSSILSDIIDQKIQTETGLTIGDEYYEVQSDIITSNRIFVELNKIRSSIAKTYHVLNEVVSACILPSELDILILSERPEITVLSLADYLLTWQLAQYFDGKAFPLNNLRIQFNQTYNKFSNDILLDSFINKIDSLPYNNNEGGELGFHQVVKNAIKKAQKVSYDEIVNLKGLRPTLILVDDFTKLLEENGRETLLRSLKKLYTNSVVAILSDNEEANSQEILSFRKRFLDENHEFISAGGCGRRNVNSFSEKCLNCSWLSTVQFQGFRKEQRKSQDSVRTIIKECERTDQFSFVIIAKSEAESENEADNFLFSLGQDYERLYDDDQQRANEDYIKLCPERFTAEKVLISRKIGQFLPISEFGTRFTLSDYNVRSDNQTQFLEITDKSKLELFGTTKTENLPVSAYSYEAMNVLAYRFFKFPQLHEFQHKVMRRILEGGNILAIAATGGGKSECYIMPSLLFSGITLVISPLISLMQDQFEERLSKRYKLRHITTFLNSTKSFKDKIRDLTALAEGKFKIVFITPEQLDNGSVMYYLKKANETVGITHLALDEAHCISQWGHDFRPAYLNIRKKLEDNGINVKIIALTATASEPVKNDICEELKLNPNGIEDAVEPGDTYVASSNRLELNLITKTFWTTHEKAKFLTERMANETDLPSIVFMPWAGEFKNDNSSVKGKNSSNNSQVELSNRVNEFAIHIENRTGVKVSIYNGKLDSGLQSGSESYGDDEQYENSEDFNTYRERVLSEPVGSFTGSRIRRHEQKMFMNGDTNIMVATKGFGMGIDKANIRRVYHRSLPGNLEAYIQEAGRAGRDRQPSDVYLLYSEVNEGSSRASISDYEIQKSFLEDRYLEKDDLSIFRNFALSLYSGSNQIVIENKDNVTLFFTSHQFYDYINLNHRSLFYKDIKDYPEYIETAKEMELYGRSLETEEQKKYLDKLINVVYKLRPLINKKKNLRASFIQKYSDAKNDIKDPEINDINALLNSTYYYGEYFKKGKLDIDKFSHAFESEGSLIAVARLLGVTMSEAYNILHDIKNSGSDTLNPSLNFKYILTPFYTVESPFKRGKKEVFEKYGFSEEKLFKIWKNTVYHNSMPKKYPKIASADELPYKFNYYNNSKYLINLPKGYEVTINKSVFEDSFFTKYQECFSDLHKSRMETDLSALNMILTSYIGVDEAGKLKDGKGDSRTCLREVILGYLQSVELINDGNCKSCSVCVPDLNFEKYTAEERLAQLTNASQETVSAKKLIQSEYQDKAPSIEELNEIMSVFEREKVSIWGYLNGFTSRLISDYNSQHIGALILRLKLYQSSRIEFQNRDFISISELLIKQLKGQSLRVLEDIVNSVNEDLLSTEELFTLNFEILKGEKNNGRIYELIKKYEEYIDDFDNRVNIWKTAIKVGKALSKSKSELLINYYNLAAQSEDPNEAAGYYDEIKEFINRKEVTKQLNLIPKKNHNAVLSLLAAWSHAADFDKPFVQDFTAKLKIKFDKLTLTRDIFDLFSEEYWENNSNSLADLFQKYKGNDIEFVEKIFSVLEKASSDSGEYLTLYLKHYYKEWEKSEKILSIIHSALKNNSKDNKLQKLFLDKVDEIKILDDYLLWYAKSVNRNDEILQIAISKRLKKVSEKNSYFRISNYIKTLIEALQGNQQTVKYLEIIAVLVSMKNKKQLNIRRIDKFTIDDLFYYIYRREYKQDLEWELKLSKEELYYILYVLLNNIDPGNHYRHKKKNFQVQALAYSGQYDLIEEMSNENPDLSVGREGIKITEYLKKEKEGGFIKNPFDRKFIESKSEDIIKLIF